MRSLCFECGSQFCLPAASLTLHEAEKTRGFIAMHGIEEHSGLIRTNTLWQPLNLAEQSHVH